MAKVTPVDASLLLSSCPLFLCGVHQAGQPLSQYCSNCHRIKQKDQLLASYKQIEYFISHTGRVRLEWHESCPFHKTDHPNSVRSLALYIRISRPRTWHLPEVCSARNRVTCLPGRYQWGLAVAEHLSLFSIRLDYGFRQQE